MRDLVTLVLLLVLVALAIRNTFSTYLLWGWAGLIALSGYLYGFMRGVKYAQWFAIATLIAFLMKSDKLQAAFKSNRTSTLMILFGIQCALTMAFAYDGLPRNAEIGTDILKTVLFCILMPMLVTTRLRLHAFMVMVALGLGFHGIVDGLKFVNSAGGHISRGLAKFGDNNSTAVALATAIPVLLYLAKYSVKKWVRLGFLGTMLLEVLAVVSTRSRGGFATLVVLAGWMIWHTKRKFAGLALLAVCVALVGALASSEWTERMNTIQTADQDSSFMIRVAAWKKSSAIAVAHPFTGGGFYAVQAHGISAKYRYAQGLLGFIETPDPHSFAAHSIYFQVMGDTGFVGFFIYIGFFINAFLTRREIKKIAKARGDSATWALDLSNTIAASLIAFMVGGSLVSAAYFDIAFILIALMETTKQVLISSLAGGEVVAPTKPVVAR